jgi:hypothetical protein
MNNKVHPVTNQIISEDPTFWRFCSFNGLTKSGLNRMVKFAELEFPNCKDLSKKVIFLFEDSDYSPLMYGVTNYIEVYKKDKLECDLQISQMSEQEELDFIKSYYQNHQR